MIRTLLASAALAATACACAPAGTAAPDSGKASAELPAEATGFITSNLAEVDPAAAPGEVARDEAGRPFGYALLGQPLPHLTGTLADGTPYDSASIDKWTVIDVWGIWCGDCMRDAPYVAALVSAINQDPDLDFLSIHVPANANRLTPEELYGKYGSVPAYFAEKGYAYPTLLDTDTSIREAMRIAWTPSYLLVSPEGIVKGFRSDLSAAEGEPVKDFIKDIARVRGESKKASLDFPVFASGKAGRLESGLSFTLQAVSAAFPGKTIISTHADMPGGTVPVFEVRDETGTLLTLTPDWTLGRVERITTSSPWVAGPRGERVGQAHLADFPDIKPSDCTGGVPETVTSLVCSDPEDVRFLRVFGPGEPGAAPDLLTDMTYAYPAPREQVPTE